MGTSSLSMSPALSVLTSSASSSSSSYTLNSIKISCFCASRTKPISVICTKTRFLQCKKSNFSCKVKERPFGQGPFISACKMTITENADGEEESPPPLLESEMNSRPRRIALFVEPSPFSYVSGYKNRFQNFIKYLREMGDEVVYRN